MLKYFDLETKKVSDIFVCEEEKEERDIDGYKERERTIEREKEQSIKRIEKGANMKNENDLELLGKRKSQVVFFRIIQLNFIVNYLM